MIVSIKKQFINTNPRIIGYNHKISEILSRLAKSLENEDLEDVRNLIIELEIVCPISGSKNWTDVKQFNLMFGTKLGASADTATRSFFKT